MQLQVYNYKKLTCQITENTCTNSFHYFFSKKKENEKVKKKRKRKKNIFTQLRFFCIFVFSFYGFIIFYIFFTFFLLSLRFFCLLCCQIFTFFIFPYFFNFFDAQNSKYLKHDIMFQKPFKFRVFYLFFIFLLRFIVWFSSFKLKSLNSSTFRLYRFHSIKEKIKALKGVY